jgi:exosortase
MENSMMRRASLLFLIVPLVILAGCLLWSLWPVAAAMAERWRTEPRYAHGYLVPLFSLALLWMRRAQIDGLRWLPNSWGLVLVALGAAIQLLGGYFGHNSVEGLAFLPYLAGIALMLGGWPVLGWAWPSILFLIFMIPLPWRLENALGPPLQRLATLASSYALQTLGVIAVSEGNVIQLDNYSIGVVEACSGLSMLITFIALSTAMAMAVKRPLVDKIVLVLSSIPVALLANIARITLTGVLHGRFFIGMLGEQFASHFYHDLAGWVMIPFALLLYWFEIWLFSHILVEVEKAPVLVKVTGEGRSAAVSPKAMAGLPRAVRGRR